MVEHPRNIKSYVVATTKTALGGMLGGVAAAGWFGFSNASDHKGEIMPLDLDLTKFRHGTELLKKGFAKLRVKANLDSPETTGWRA